MKTKKSLISTIVFFALFIIFTILVSFVNVEAIGPEGSEVGFAALNGAVFNALGSNEIIYSVTELLGFIPLLLAGCFAIFGIRQAIKRKNPLKVDIEIIMLGAFYVAVLAFYVAFEIITINYRPILIDGVLEASYPSSHTMLATCFMTTAIIELNRLLKGKKTLLIVIDVIFVAIAASIVIGRLLAGVHWLTDIIAGLLLSGALISLYCLAVAIAKEKIAKKAEKENAND